MPTKSEERELTPSPNPFVGFPRPPEPAEIRRVLGRSAAVWDGLRTSISEAFGQVTENWAVPAKRHGWSLRLKLKKRTILHLGPRSGHFVVVIILGDKAVAAVRESELAPEAMTMVEQAPSYTEGRVFRFEIRSEEDTELVRALAKIKMDH